MRVSFQRQPRFSLCLIFKGNMIPMVNTVATYTLPSCGSGHVLLQLQEIKLSPGLLCAVGTLNIQLENSNFKSRFTTKKFYDMKVILKQYWDIPAPCFSLPSNMAVASNYPFSLPAWINKVLWQRFKDNKASFKVNIFFFHDKQKQYSHTNLTGSR